MRLFNVFGSLAYHYQGTGITFSELIQKIKTPNEWVEIARKHGKGTSEYDRIKEYEIEAFFPNSYTTENSRSPRLNPYKCTSGYIYLDFDDFPSEEEARKYRDEVTRYPFIAACWLSLSKKGLSALVIVKNCDAYKYEIYWDRLNEIFDYTLDPQTKCYFKLCCISYDDSVYVNENSLYFDEEYDFSFHSLKFRTYIPESEFQGQPFIVYPEGRDVWEVNLFRYKYVKNGVLINNPIKRGSRNKSLGYISMILIHLNPEASKSQIGNTLLSINRKYCEIPLSKDAVIKIFEDNYKKYKEGRLDVGRYAHKQHVFFNKAFRLTRSEIMSITVNETNKRKGKTSDDTLDQIFSCIKELMNGEKIIQKRIAEKLGKSTITVKRYYRDYPEIKDMVKAYNQTRKKGIISTYTSYRVGDNNVITDTFLNHDLMPSEEQVPPHSSANIVISDTFLTQSFK